ncbi:phage tail terminator-like protein [Variovorax sp. J22R193]|uniref:phage tail terminator-like protein n=1 Tax=Variovorax fucosicus TaxID=3053517 RepID=UPI002577435E|nr:phage tail terminator-like protein [Variovorax sp. J22R193]MDM0042143.1 phage tail terminator-like protein [Variovorax sp. J22R193]
MDITTIRSLLLTQLRTAAGEIGTIVAENETFNAKNRAHWNRFTFTPIETSVETTGATPWTRIGGFATISIFEPKGTGVDSLYARAETVKSLFKASTVLGAEPDFVHVEKSWSEGTIEEDVWTQVQVLVRCYAFVQAI